MQIRTMNRTLQYFKNIKFNNFVNKTISNEGKKKITIVDNNNRAKKLYQRLHVRKYTTKSSSFNNEGPPKNPYWILIALGCGILFKMQENSN